MRAAWRLAGLGLALGMLAGAVETARLVWLVPASSVPWRLAVYAAAIDGAAAAVVAFLAAAGWALVRRLRHRPANKPEAGLPPGPIRGMSRRALLRLSAGSLAAVAVVGAGAAMRRSVGGDVALAAQSLPRGTVSRPPNLVLITVDTLRADRLGSYGNSTVHTPALDALAAGGARFLWHFIQEPQTNPSHASMFTGQYPSTSGIRVHMVDKVPARLDTLAGLLAAGGYQTAGLYSWLSFDAQYSGLNRGFQVYRNTAPPPSSFMANPAIKGAMAQYRVAEQYLVLPQALNQVVPLKSDVESTAKGDATRTTDAAIAQLRTFSASAPFFLWVHYFDPHYPYQPPASFAPLYSPNYNGPINGSMAVVDEVQTGKLQPRGADLQRLIGLYESEITYMDGEIARLLKAIDALNHPSGTAIALTSDHGESFGEHADLDEGGDYFHPHSLYNTEQWVPLLLSWPGHVPPGGSVNAPTQAIDIFPTFLEMAGLRASPQAQGASVLPLLDGRDDGATRAAYGSMPDYVFTSVASGGWKLLRNNASGSQRLFDLIGDPAEQHDQLAAEPAVAAALAANLTSWMKAAHVS
ncbi:MAG TPA: sulfatase [Chloroflexota bacterium]|nr:sulfatase [Chloroflexota bacterium]